MDHKKFSQAIERVREQYGYCHPITEALEALAGDDGEIEHDRPTREELEALSWSEIKRLAKLSGVSLYRASREELTEALLQA